MGSSEDFTALGLITLTKSLAIWVILECPYIIFPTLDASGIAKVAIRIPTPRLLLDAAFHVPVIGPETLYLQSQIKLEPIWAARILAPL
jgi:hypothetical protein